MEKETINQKVKPTANKIVRHFYTAILEGVNAKTVCSELSFTKGLPQFHIVGLANEAIKESKERIKSALLYQDFIFPPLRIVVNLAPSDFKKSGSHFDLPIALAIGLDQQYYKNDTKLYIFGELSLDGKVKSTALIFPLILSLSKQINDLKVLVPFESAKALAQIPNITIYAIKDLQEAFDFFKTSPKAFNKVCLSIPMFRIKQESFYYHEDFVDDFSDVIGQEKAKRAALIASAGMHNIILQGSPGSGKSMIVKRIATILPPLTLDELLEQAMLGFLEYQNYDFKAKRPFRQIHHSATKSAVFGGGSLQSKIGEIALAHNGVLFLDELPHFSKTILEALREPLQDYRILISRVHSKVAYNTKFLLAAAMNPCPCGNLLNPNKNCRCSDLEINRYNNKLSDPFLDRIDLVVNMQEDDHSKLRTNSKTMRESVFKAFKMQKQRGQQDLNAKLNDQETQELCKLDTQCNNILEMARKNLNLSLRSLVKIKKVARTIADLDQSQEILKIHLLEALNFRKRS